MVPLNHSNIHEEIQKYDCEDVGEVLSIFDEIFRQTFKFQKGDWLYIRHEVTGWDKTPVPNHVNNSEIRLTYWIEN